MLESHSVRIFWRISSDYSKRSLLNDNQSEHVEIVLQGRLMTGGNYYVYITTNPGKTVLYTGVTNNLRRRIIEHRNNKGDKKTFVGKYYCYKLIYYECFPEMNKAIYREKEIKNLTREKKEELISIKNPKWSFLNIL